MIILLLIVIVIMGYVIFFLYDAFKQKSIQYNRVKRNFLLLWDWKDIESMNCQGLDSILQKKGYNRIIIYGWGYLGEQLYKELRDTLIEVKGILDRKHVSNFYKISSYTLHDELPDADAVIVTVSYDIERIKKDISEIAAYPILDLEELLYLKEFED